MFSRIPVCIWIINYACVFKNCIFNYILELLKTHKFIIQIHTHIQSQHTAIYGFLRSYNIIIIIQPYFIRQLQQNGVPMLMLPLKTKFLIEINANTTHQNTGKKYSDVIIIIANTIAITNAIANRILLSFFQNSK